MLDRRSGTNLPSTFATGLNDLQTFDTAELLRENVDRHHMYAWPNTFFSSQVDDCYGTWLEINQVLQTFS